MECGGLEGVVRLFLKGWRRSGIVVIAWERRVGLRGDDVVAWNLSGVFRYCGTRER